MVNVHTKIGFLINNRWKNIEIINTYFNSCLFDGKLYVLFRNLLTFI